MTKKFFFPERATFPVQAPRVPLRPWFLLLFLACAWHPCLRSAETAKPNILIFLVDDMGVMDTSVPFLVDSEGNPVERKLNRVYRTPNMKKLADRGTRFDTFYANSVCSPTRVSLMTGQFSARHHVTQFIKPESNNAGEFGPPEWEWHGISEGQVTLPAVLKEAGYRTIHVGKGHFGPVGSFAEDPAHFGFDINIAGCAWGQPGSYYGKESFGHGEGGRAKRAVPDLEKYHGQEIYLTDALTLEMNAAIADAVSAGEPFFAYLSHYAVHGPFQEDKRYTDNYTDIESEALTAFATMIEGMDKSLGDVLTQLEKLGVAENTLVIFLGDNGTDAPIGPEHEVSCAAPLRGKKGTHYEGGMRVPCIISWAKPNESSPLQQGLPIGDRAVSRTMGTVCDIFPTVLTAAGVSNREGHVLDGIDLFPYLPKDAEGPGPREFLMHFPHGHRSSYFTSFRKGDWKVIYHYSPEPEKEWERVELFNLGNDPYEENNLAGKNPKKRLEMLQAMSAALENSGAQYPLADDGKTALKPVVE